MRRAVAVLVLVIVGSLIVPTAAAEISFKAQLPSADVGVQVEERGGRFAEAQAAVTVNSFSNGCIANPEYEATAGPLAVDLGGHYVAEGGGSHIQNTQDEQFYPLQAHVEESDNSFVSFGTTVSVWSEGTAENVLTGSSITANADDAETC